MAGAEEQVHKSPRQKAMEENGTEMTSPVGLEEMQKKIRRKQHRGQTKTEEESRLTMSFLLLATVARRQARSDGSPIIQELERLRQENCYEFKANQYMFKYMLHSSPSSI